MPLVSVIVPVYNAGDALIESLESLAAQTLRDIEVICINDGSTDGSDGVIREYVERDPRFKVIDQQNAGAAVARNRGLDAATGDYFAILDADDVYEPRYLETVYQRALETDADIAVCRCDDLLEETGEHRPYPYSIRDSLLPVNQPFSLSDVSQDAFKLFIGWAWDKLYRAEFVKESALRFQNLRTSNDMFFVFCALVRAERIATLDDVLVHHRRSMGTLSVTREKSWHCFHDALVAIRKQLLDWGLFQRYERDYINYCLHASLWNYTTLVEPTKGLLLDKLTSEWFEEFGITSRQADYFYSSGDFKCFQNMMKAANPKVSIIIPSLNSIEYYQECLESALAQDMKEIEIICVDAGSTDGTVEFIDKHAKGDPRIRHLSSEIRSYGHQMNMGIAAARGDWMLILESDDYIQQHTCSYYYNLATKNSLDFIKSDHRIFWGDGESRKSKVRKLSAFAAYYDTVLNPSERPDLLYLTILTQPGLYNLSFLRENEVVYHESPGASYQDNGFWIQVFTQAKRAMFTHEELYMLRRDNPGSSVASKGKVFAMCDEYDFIHQRLIDRGLERFLPMCAFKRYGNYEFTAGRIGDWYRPMFFERAAEDLRKLEEAGELDRSYFNPRTWSTIQEIMRLGSDYYHLEWYWRTRSNEATAKSRSEAKRANAAKKKLAKVQGSKAYRFGRAIAAPVRLIRDGKPLKAAEGQPAKKKVLNPFADSLYDFYRGMSGEELSEQVRCAYAKRMGGKLVLENPASFNEHIQALKVFDPRRDEKRRLADGWGARCWVKERAGEEYLPECYGLWDSADAIEWDKLPNAFMLVCTHGDDMCLEIEDKEAADKDYVREQVDTWLNGDFAYKSDLRLEYAGITPQVMAIAPQEEQSDIYHVWCFGGSAVYVQVDALEEGKNKTSFYTPSWEPVPIACGLPSHGTLRKKPKDLRQIVDLAERIAGDFDFVCVSFGRRGDDGLVFYNIDFSPMGGYCNWRPARADFIVGKAWITASN